MKIRVVLVSSACATMVVIFALLSAPYWVSAFVYRPTPLAPSTPKACGVVGAQEASIPSASVDHLSALWVPSTSDTSPVVLMVHGRSANICTRASIAAKLRSDGFGVLLFDYRGYGRSSGRPSETGLTEDAVSAYDWLRRQGVTPQRIIVIGQSLGDAPATQLSVSRPVAALVLVSPFTSLPGAIADRLGWPFVERLPWTRNRFDVGVSLKALSIPVLFIVSRQDGLVPYANSRRASRDSRLMRWLEADGLGHDGLLAAVARDGRLTSALLRLLSESKSPAGGCTGRAEMASVKYSSRPPSGP